MYSQRALHQFAGSTATRSTQVVAAATDFALVLALLWD
jgi:hypothetical protein